MRVSTAEQNISRQEVLMEQLGVEKVFVDKLSGKDTNRPQLKEVTAAKFMQRVGLKKNTFYRRVRVTAKNEVS